MAPFREGMRVRGRFRLVEPIGTGGMSQVWRARDEVLGRDVALKLLVAPSGAGDPAPRSATVREARLAATTTHPNLTQVYDCGETVLPDGTQVPYLVMELVTGETLAARLAAGPLPWPEVARVGADVARALATAHRAGVVHRDVKPTNVVLTPAGAKLLDFGIAARSGSRAERGRLVGTPTYAAPERIDADVARPEGDVYSLGVLCFEALTGRPPLELPSWEDARDARQRSRRDRAGSAAAVDLATRLPEVPEPLARLCVACLSLDPAGRPDADRLAGELSAIAEGHAVEERSRPYAVGTAPPPQPPTTPDRGRPRPGRGRRLALAAATVLAVLAVALSVTVLWPGTLARWLGARPTTGADVVAAAPEATSRAPTDPYGALNALDQTISRALATGAIDRGTARDLRERLDEVHTELERRDPRERTHKVQGKAAELRTEIQRRRAGGDITPAVADRLTTQLAPLAGD